MLTKDLIKLKFADDKIVPGFIDIENPTLRELAGEIINCFEKNLNAARAEITEKVAEILPNYPKRSLLIKGLAKLMLDRSEFEQNSDETVDFRQKIFTQSANLLKKPLSEAETADFEVFDLEKLRQSYRFYSQAMKENFSLPASEIAKKLYSDLPDKQKLVSAKPINPDKLLNRYNVSLIQWLLLHSKKLTLSLVDCPTSDLRALMKSIRFHQLMAKISVTGEKMCQKGTKLP